MDPTGGYVDISVAVVMRTGLHSTAPRTWAQTGAHMAPSCARLSAMSGPSR